MSDEYHDQWGTPIRHPPEAATSDSLNRPPRSREAAALDLAREVLTKLALPTGDGETRLEHLMRLAAQTALDRMAIILGDER